MFGYVILTAFLFQKGSSESKDPEETEPVDRDPRKSKRRDAPWPVRRGGLVLKLYENSLSLAFLLFFLVSIALHASGRAREVYNEEQAEHGQPEHLVSAPICRHLSVLVRIASRTGRASFSPLPAMVVFSIFLRQRGSPESKPVDSPHHQTGSE